MGWIHIRSEGRKTYECDLLVRRDRAQSQPKWDVASPTSELPKNNRVVIFSYIATLVKKHVGCNVM